MMNRIVKTGAVVALAGAMALATAAPSQARNWGRTAAAAGIGLAAGAIIGSTIANRGYYGGPAYAYDSYYYGGGPYYSYGAPAYAYGGYYGGGPAYGSYYDEPAYGPAYGYVGPSFRTNTQWQMERSGNANGGH